MAEAPATPEFALSEEQQALRDLVRSYAVRTFTDEAVRARLDEPTAHDPAHWQALGSDLGVLGLALPASLGGDAEDGAAGTVELALVAEELGRALAPVPLLGTVALAGTALARSGGPVAEELVPAIVQGRVVVALAATDASGRWRPDAPDVRATEGPDGWTLDGTASHVLDAEAADVVLVVARHGADLSLLAVEHDAPGLAVEALTTLDQTRRLGRVTLGGTPARLVGRAGGALEVVSAARDVGAVVLAAEAVGAMSRLLALSVEHARTRLQFGRAIGSFQAVKHRCADMHVAVEQSRSTAFHAAWALADPTLDDPRVAVDLATVETAADYLAVAKDTVQVHGGIGFTWEHPTHLYYKRATSDASLLGGRAAAADRLAAAVLDTPAAG